VQAGRPDVTAVNARLAVGWRPQLPSGASLLRGRSCSTRAPRSTPDGPRQGAARPELRRIEAGSSLQRTTSSRSHCGPSWNQRSSDYTTKRKIKRLSLLSPQPPHLFFDKV
jgi:hypothetical protein